MKALRTALQNRLEVIGSIAAILVCVALIWSLAVAEASRNVGQLYVIENGKWLPVARFAPVRIGG